MKSYFWLILIALFFLITRLYKIDMIPSSVYWDEASIGYNAFAITQDFKDEWGEFLPLHFRAFGEFKLPVYIYSVALFVKLFGLSEITLRLPAVIYGLGSVIALYFLVYRVTKNKLASDLSSFIFALTPWTFIFTRTAYEASAGLFFFLLFVYLLLSESKKRIILAIVFGIAAIYSYNSFRILVPVFLLVWGIKNIKNFKSYLLPGLIFIISSIPIIRLYYYDYGAVRLTTVGVKSPTEFVTNYFSYFTYDFLFKNGDVNNRSQVPNWGQVFFIGLPLIILGLLWLVKNKSKLYWVFILFILIAPIPGALTRESPHALRSILLAPTFSIFSAMGLLRLVERFKIVKFKNYFLFSSVFVYLCFFGNYYFDFINNYNNQTKSDWQYQYKEIFINLDNTSDNLIITDEFAQPYICALYYLKYPPKVFRETVKYNSVSEWGFSTVASFGNFEFKR